jgi:Kef-type K+ transport system membrane component KefB/mannitol/fructose-specific phosphotransferase system IIA component (Ntr-type)
MHYLAESHILLFLIQLFIILLLARSSGEIFRRWKQPVLTAELLIGIIIGPTIFGRFFPNLFSALFPSDAIQQGMLETVAQIGVLFLLLDTGLEIDFSSAWRQKRNALIIAFSDIIIPMIIAFTASFLLPDFYLVDPNKRIEFALFMAAVMAISAMPVVSRVLHDLKILKTDLGFLIMSALAVNDVIGWALFTIILTIFTQGFLNFGSTFFILMVIVGFSALALTAGRYATNKIIDFFHKSKMPEPASSFTFACLLGLLFGAFMQKLGIHALFGFFIAGIAVGEAKNLKEETRIVISQMVHSLFIPIFFVNIGLKIDFISNFDIYLVSLVTIIGITGRFLGTWIGVSFSKVPKVNKTLISITHTPGGMMEIVVSLLALEIGLIKPSIFIAIVCGAIFSSIVMGPWMRLALKKREDIPILEFLRLDTGLQFLSESDKRDALKNMVSRLPLFVKSLDLKALTHEIFEREENYSTAVGEEIAIPHIRLENISDPILLFGLSKNGIDWNAPDGKLVHFVFFLLSPTLARDLHIEILSKVIKIMQNKNNQKVLKEAGDLKELSEAIRNIFA